MNPPIERVRYYDGEYLRSFDFEDEQTYHVEMRRRLNRSLHLWGIAQGLELVQNDAGGGINQVWINPGMAIDALGREIYVFAPHTFGDADIAANRVSYKDTYDVWIRYKRTPATPPSAGYGICNDKNQYTRWVESYSVLLLPAKTNPAKEPGFEDPDSENPDQDKVSVLLGSVSIDPNSVTDQFTIGPPPPPPLPPDDRRVYVGVRAERIKPPVDAAPDPKTAPYPILDSNTAHHPPTSVGIEGQLFAEQNLIVGDDFKIDPGKILPPVVSPYPKLNGNAKMAGDLFVQGNIYWPVKDQWLAFSEYVKQFMPDVAVGRIDVTVATPTTPDGSVTGTDVVTVTCNRIGTIKSVTPFASIIALEFNDRTDLNTIVKGNDTVKVIINTVDAPAAAILGKTCKISVNWTAMPVLNHASAITRFSISVLAVCFP